MAESTKKEKKKKEKKTKATYYEIKGNAVSRKKRFCPKCGSGVFMADHKDRSSCGTCGYTEWKAKQNP